MIRTALFFFAFAGCSALVGAQATRPVPPAEAVYGDIERLAAAGLIDTLVMGARPFSEREVIRLLSEARRNLDRAPSAKGWAAQAIEAGLGRYARAANRPYDALRAEAVALDSPYRGIPSDANGAIDAFINPLASNRGGRPLADGLTGSLETEHSVTLGSFVVFAINPRVTGWSMRGSDDGASVQLQSASLNLLFGNVAVEVGRDYTVFGQSSVSGLVLSPNAPTINLVRLSSDRPFTIPWLSRIFGPLRASMFVGDVGEYKQLHPHTKLAGYHISALPHPRFEIGVEVVDAMGGRGGEPASFGDRIVDAIPLIDALFRSGTDFQFSNKMAGIDFHWRMPSWRGFELYAEGDVDDFDIRRARSSFLEDGGIIGGMAFSCVLECGRLGVRAEYHQTGIRFYTHSDYPLERRGVLLGDPLGPRALGAYVTLDGESSAGYLAVTSALEVRSGNKYGSAVNGPDTEGFHFVLTERHPGEKRRRVVATWSPDNNRGRASVSISAGGERVTNFGFIAGANRTNWLARASITVRP